MGYYIKLIGYRPSERDDGRVWREAEIWEAATPTGPRVHVDTRSLVPLDDDPEQPAVRSFTTTEASGPHGLWYWVEFVDEAGGRQLLGPSFNAAEAFVPTPGEIRAEFAQMPWDEWGHPAPEPGEVDSLEVPLRETETELMGYLGAIMTANPDARAPLVRRALKLLLVYNVGSSMPEVVETAFDYDTVKSMSAGGYSETRRETGSGGLSVHVLHPWPAMNRLLHFVLNYEHGGVPLEQGPGVGQVPFEPSPYEGIMQHRAGETWPRGVDGPLWPSQPWVTNAPGKA